MKKTIILLLLALMAIQTKGQNLQYIWQESIERFVINDFHQVIVLMDQYIKISPKAHAYYNRGIAKLNLGDLKSACEDMKKAMDLGYTKNKKFTDFMCNDEYKLKLLKDNFYEDDSLYAEQGYRPEYTRKDSLRGALRPERTCFDVTFYELTVKIIPPDKSIRGKNIIHFKVIEPTKKIQLDLFEQYKIESITWNNQPLNYSREFDAVFIEFPKELSSGNTEKIEFNYSGIPQKAKNPPWEGGFVWKKTRGKLWVSVACELLGASSWWPNKDHLSDEPDSMQINIEVPKKYQAISNGTLKNVLTTEKKYKQYQWFVHYPINNYNVTFYLGNYVEFSDTMKIGNEVLKLNYHVLPHHLKIAKEHFKQAKEIVQIYSKDFGDYPFIKDGFGLVESSYEGMEHQTAIAYGNNFNRKEDKNNLTKNKYDFIIVHEAAHEWWGNAVTVADMADIWIHEGFATYAELLFFESAIGYSQYLNELIAKSRIIFNFWPLIQNRDVNENAFASNDCYTKGAMILHCLRAKINNDSLFFRIIKDFWNENKYGIVATNDFIRCVNEHVDENYQSFFDKYLYETGLPLLSYSFTINADGKLTLKYNWKEVADDFTMPFSIRTDKGIVIRLNGTAEEQTKVLDNTFWFSFLNEWTTTKNAAITSITYFRTNWER